jgi:hypothetical protein
MFFKSHLNRWDFLLLTPKLKGDTMSVMESPRAQRILKQILKEHCLDKSKCYVGQLITNKALYGTSYSKFYIVKSINKIDDKVVSIFGRDVKDGTEKEVAANLHIDVADLQEIIQKEFKANGLDYSDEAA